jgi:Flp pilus assembly protein TadD
MPLLARCVTAAPDNVAYRCSLGMVSLTLGKAEAAALVLLPAANATPMNMDARLLLARALGALKRWQEAHAILVETTTAFPNAVPLWSWRGRAASKIGHLDDAESSWREALKQAPGDPEILNNLGVLLRRRGRLKEAVEAYQIALAAAPDHVVCLSNLGNVLGQLGDETGAEIYLRRAVSLDPKFVDGVYNLGAHLVRIDRPEAAVPYLRRAVAADAKRWDALTNLGVALVALGELAEAEDCYRQALTLNPRNPEAHYDLAWLLLLTGRWTEGWVEYEWRWKMPTFTSRRRDFKQPLWDGRKVDGTLLLHAEQGLGDAIQFVRYARLAAPLCDRLVIEAPPSLAPLFRHAVAAGHLPGEVMGFGDGLPDCVAHAPYMSLPGLFGSTPDNVPAWPAYLSAPEPARPDLVVPNRGRRRIGLVWAGSPDNRIDRQRSMPAEALKDLMAADADFVSLQVGPPARQVAALPLERITFKSEGVVKDFADTAAVIAQLDLVIGVDTAVLHLAGALGKPAWMLLPFAPDYRWLAHGETTAWYPSLRLFRQTARGDWTGPLAAAAAALSRL